MIHFNEDEPMTMPTPEVLENAMGGRLFDKKFLEQRKIFFWGVVDDDSARYVVNRLLYLDAEKPGEEITLYINSPGGMVTSGMVVHDTMKMLSSPVATVCMGLAASMGSVLLAAGAKGRRSIFPSGEVMIHQPSIGGYFQAKSVDIEIQARQIEKTRMTIAKIYTETCGQSMERILKDFDRDYYMDAKEALKYGIVDKIVEKL
jgi:ATP-dependent Clp protease, protease subunit